MTMPLHNCGGQESSRNEGDDRGEKKVKIKRELEEKS